MEIGVEEVRRVTEWLERLRGLMIEVADTPDMPEAWRARACVRIVDSALQSIGDQTKSPLDRFRAAADWLRGIFQGYAHAEREFHARQDGRAIAELRALYNFLLGFLGDAYVH